MVTLSLPVRGAWIEICDDVPESRIFASLPVRGAWIEIFRKPLRHCETDVAPRAGSVD